MNRSRKKRALTKAELRAMGATPGRLATRYSPDGERAEVRQLTAETRSRPPFGPRLTDGDEFTHASESKGER